MRFSADSSEYSHFIVNELIWNLLAAADNERGNNDADNGGHLNTFSYLPPQSSNIRLFFH